MQRNGGIDMKQFNLTEYLNNPSRKVVTRDGRKARVICTDAKNNFPVVALIETPDGKETLPCGYKKDGTYITDEKLSCDLFFAPEKHEGWMNLYKDGYTPTYTGVVHNSEEKAIKNRQENAVATIKIEWEE